MEYAENPGDLDEEGNPLVKHPEVHKDVARFLQEGQAIPYKAQLELLNLEL